jgi:DNA-binding NarL/FixJ family response regulator
MTTVVLAEDAQLVREGLRALLERAGEFDVVAEASTGAEAVQLVEKLKPKVLALEILLPDLHGLEVLKHIKESAPTNAVVVSSHSNATYVVESLKHGAVGYVLKDGPAEEFITALRCASRGELFLSRAVRNCTLEASIGRTFGKDNGHDRLTMRERVVLELAAEGLTNGQIADRLSISRRTVESHRASLMQKMGLRSQTDLVRFAIRNKIITA